MIVKCEQCQTRFKIPDEKVTDKGVKVRCTKCGHTFRVTRESAASASAAPVPGLAAPGAVPSDAGFDPFEAFGKAPQPPKGTHTTRPGDYPEGVEASRAPQPVAPPPPAPWNAPDSGVHEEIFQETTRVIPLQVPPEARPPVPSLPPLPFDFAPGAAAPRQTPPAPGQGLPGPGAVSFRPGASSPVPLPGVPSVAPSAPAGARSLPTPPQKPASGGFKPAAPAAAPPRTLAPPAMPPPGPAAPASSARPGARPSAPAPAPAAAPGGAPDLFTEFFANPAGGSAPAAPLPARPDPGLPPVASFPAPAQARPAAPVPSFGVPDADPFGSVSGDLADAPADPGPAPEFDPMAMFSDPVPAAPPVPSVAGRLTPLPAPASSGSPPTGRPLSMPPTGAPPSGLGRPPAVAPTSAPRMAPPAMAPPPAAVPAPVSSASFADEDPFGASNAELSGSPADFGFEALPAAAPAPAPSAVPMAFADDDPFGPSALGLGSAADEPAVTAPDHFAAPAPMSAAPSVDEFGPSFRGSTPQQQAAPPLPDAGFTTPGPMDFGMISDEQMSTDSQPMAAPGGMPDPFGAPAPGGGMDDPFGGPAPGGGMDDPFAAPGGIPDPFAAQANAGGMPADPFASAEPAFSPTTTGRQMIGSSEGFLTQTDTSHRTISPTETGRHLLDLPSHPGAEPEQGGGFSAEQGGGFSAEQGGEFSAAGSRELIDLPTQPTEAPPPAAKPAPTLASSAIARPAGRPADMGIPERRKQTTAQAVTGQVAYLTIAAGLLLALTAVGGVYMKEGRVDPSALSPAHLMKLLTPSQFAARAVANGLYDTRGGTPVFYVRGEAENRSGKAVKVKVLAALYDGDQRVKSAEGLAGVLPTPEELHALTNAEAVTQLRSKLDAGAVVIPPGGKAPFALVFQEYPQELSAFRLQVTMEPAPEGGSPP